MGKARAKAAATNIPNKPCYSRVSYLYQAATFLAQQRSFEASSSSKMTARNDASASTSTQDALPRASRRLVSDLRNISLKTQIRLSPAMKHSLCKSCNTILVAGSTCTDEIENKSKERKKPWADILVRKCNTCNAERRFPLAAERQKRRPRRQVDTQIISPMAEDG